MLSINNETVFFLTGSNTDTFFGTFSEDATDVLVAFDENFNFLGFLGLDLIGTDNPLQGIGGISLNSAGNIVVSSQLGDTILEFDGTNGEFIGVFGEANTEDSGLDFPAGNTLGPDGNLYVSSLDTEQILSYDGSTGEFLGVVVEGNLTDEDSDRFTGLDFGPDGNLYVGLNPPVFTPELGLGEVQVYAPETGELLQVIGGLDFAASLAFGPDGLLYISDNPASIVDTSGVPVDSTLESRVVIYDVSGDEPQLVNEFNVGIGDAGTITVAEDPQLNETVIYLPNPESGTISTYTTTGELIDTATVPLPPQADGVDEDGISRPLGSLIFPVEDDLSTQEPSSLSVDDNNIFTITGTEETELLFTLESVDAGFVNEVGVVVVDNQQGEVNGITPGTDGYVEEVLSNGEVIFSALNSTSQDFLATNEFFSENLSRSINGFEGGDNLVFYLISNSTADSVLAGETPSEQVLLASNFDGGEFQQLLVENLEEVAGFQLVWDDQPEAESDLSFDDLVLTVTVGETSTTLGTALQGGNQQELIDLRDLDSQEVLAEIIATANAGFNNRGGLYTVLDEQGTVEDPVTGELLLPGDEGYATIAISNSVVEFDEIDPEALELSGGLLYAPYFLADGNSSDAYFPFLEANPDTLDHIRLLGDNSFAFEDSFGGGDGSFDDFIFQVELSIV